jgi:hypothetical protein
MKGWRLFLIASLVAALAPLYRPESSSVFADEEPFPGWPRVLHGRALKQLPLTAREKHFANAFPGKIGRFSDGQRQYIIRWVTRPTRRLHPATDCFRAFGYKIKNLPLWRDSRGFSWLSFKATKYEKRLRVYERINDCEDNTWTDVSAWYWAATFGGTDGPWWVVTVIEGI